MGFLIGCTKSNRRERWFIIPCGFAISIVYFDAVWNALSELPHLPRSRSAAMIRFMASMPTLTAPVVSSVMGMARPAFSRS